VAFARSKLANETGYDKWNWIADKEAIYEPDWRDWWIDGMFS
jgi:hypothetical protein